MGPLAMAVLGASLLAMRWLLYLTALLASTAFLALWFRGDDTALPGLALAAILSLIFGYLCGMAAVHFSRSTGR